MIIRAAVFEGKKYTYAIGKLHRCLVDGSSLDAGRW